MGPSDPNDAGRYPVAIHRLQYHANPVIPIKALTFWEDIRFDEPVKMMDTSTFQWKKIASRLTQMQANPKKKFGRIL